MPDSYLEIAEKTIRDAGRPLHPKEILSIARERGILPSHLHGKTQYKTLAARLSTEIRDRAKSSPFFRTAANRFFLRDMKTDSQEEYLAPRRQKTLHNERVLTVNASYLKNLHGDGLIHSINDILKIAQKKAHLGYELRRTAERRFDVKQVITYALIYRNGSVLTYRRGLFSNASDELLGKRSIGFGGHVTDEDLNLFDSNDFGILETARRELYEELLFQGDELIRLHENKNLRIICGIDTNETIEAQKHIAVTVVYFCSNDFEPVKNEMSINDLRWTDLRSRENELDAFEPWSRMVLEAIYSGDLAIHDFEN